MRLHSEKVKILEILLNQRLAITIKGASFYSALYRLRPAHHTFAISIYKHNNKGFRIVKV